jgi:hypothetical protein
MRFATWSDKSLYRTRSLKTVARELGKYKLNLMGVQEVRWKNSGTERAEENEDHQLGDAFLYIRESYQHLGQ